MENQVSQELVARKETSISPQTDISQITEYLDTTGLTRQLTQKEKAMFINIARAYGLNPFKREIYCNVYGSGNYRQCAIITGYEVYLKRAERTGKLDGWKWETSGSIKNGDLQATIIIYRKDWQHPFTHTVLYEECVQKTFDEKLGQERPNKIWQKMPSFMLRKVAAAQGFRLCFPDELGGMPYTPDEISDDPIERNITPLQEQIEQQPPQESTDNKATIDSDNAEPEARILTDNEKQLEALLHKHKNIIRAEIQKMITDAMLSGDQTKITDILTRTKNYLSKKGVAA